MQISDLRSSAIVSEGSGYYDHEHESVDISLWGTDNSEARDNGGIGAHH